MITKYSMVCLDPRRVVHKSRKFATEVAQILHEEPGFFSGGFNNFYPVITSEYIDFEPAQAESMFVNQLGMWEKGVNSESESFTWSPQTAYLTCETSVPGMQDAVRKVLLKAKEVFGSAVSIHIGEENAKDL